VPVARATNAVAYHGTEMNERILPAVQAQLKRVAYLLATGPNPFDYWVWADQTEAMLTQAFGDASDEASSFRAAVSERGRTSDQRGLLGDMTLGLHGEWGIWARLGRGRAVLERIADPGTPG
jgi:hypothetical protein